MLQLRIRDSQINKLMKRKKKRIGTEPFPSSDIVEQHGHWRVEGGRQGVGDTKPAPQATCYSPSCLWAPAVQAFFPCLSKAPPQLKVFAYAVPSAWETTLALCSPTSPPLLTLSLKCHTLAPTQVSLLELRLQPLSHLEFKYSLCN